MVARRVPARPPRDSAHSGPPPVGKDEGTPARPARMFPESTRLGCPLVTPFDADGAVDHGALASLVEHVVDGGVDALVPCGTTGEFPSLTAAEQRRVVETVVGAAPDGVPVVAGAGATAVEDVRARIDAAANAGADAVLVPPPYFLTASEPAGEERFLAAVAEDSPLPVCLYNIPPLVGAEVAPETVAALAERESVVALKDSSGDLAYVGDVLARAPEEFRLFQGFDGALVPGVYLGMAGGINALSHLVPGPMADAVDAVQSGEHDRARAIQRTTIDPLFRFCRAHGFAPTVKAALAAEGVVPSAAVRPPLTLPTRDARDEIARTVHDVGG